MTVSPVASSEKIQTALTNLGTPDGFIAYDVVPLLQQLVVALGNITSGGGSSSGAITGEGKLWFTDTAPTGWLICDGSVVSRTTYADLFAVIGTTFGSGDGSTTFTLPNFSETVPVGKGSGLYGTIGNLVGSQTAPIYNTNLPAISTDSALVDTGSSFEAITSVSYSATPSPSEISIVQPSLVVNFIIKT